MSTSRHKSLHFLLAMAALVLALPCCRPPRESSTLKEPTTIEVPSTLDGTMQKCWFVPSPKKDPSPLLVLLHHWSSSYNTFDSAPWRAEAEKRGWNVLIPDFRGPNKRPEACASLQARQDILDAVEYVRRHNRIDEKRIYLAGQSGGGHMAMVMAAHAPETWTAVSAWCGISDLAAWHHETKEKDRKYWQDIEAVVGGAPGSAPRVDQELRARSPLSIFGNVRDLPVDLNTGIDDGHTGSVPVHHTLDAFNVLARVLDAAPVTDDEIRLLSEKKPLSKREKQDSSYGRKIWLRRFAGTSRVTVFEGGHEDIPSAACKWLAEQKKAD